MHAEEERAYDDDHVRVARLHTRRRRSVLVPFKILSVDHSQDGIEPEIMLRLPFQLANLEGKRCRKCGAPTAQQQVRASS